MFIPKTVRVGFFFVCVFVVLAGCNESRAENDVEDASGESADSEMQLGVVTNGLPRAYESAAELARDSELIVRGTVAEQRAPFVVQPGEPPFERRDPDMYVPAVYTDVVIQISEVLKGSAEETVTVRQVGGTVENVTQKYEGAPEFAKGDDLLLFLKDYSDEG